MFDPGWRGKQQLLSEDVTTDAIDLGGDPQGVIDRQAQCLAHYLHLVLCRSLHAWH